jgi:predicted ester cyclase
MTARHSDRLERIEANKTVVRRFFDGTHTGQLDVIDDTVAEDIVTHGFPGGANPHDRESYKQFFRGFAQSFSDMKFEILAMVADEHHVAVRFKIDVVHTGPFAGVAPTGRPVSFTGMVQYRVRDGQIAETWLHVDQLALLAQVGAIEAKAA